MPQRQQTKYVRVDLTGTRFQTPPRSFIRNVSKGSACFTSRLPQIGQYVSLIAPLARRDILARGFTVA